MKILLDKYPKGSYKGQMSDGKFMDGYLYNNLEVLANKIADDMTFLGVIYSSTLEVGTGKSTLATQIGEAWQEIMKRKHNIDVPFTINNVVFKPKDLIERSFKLPKYSCILLDEWEDQTYWSELGRSLRTFFRKCRQLNLFMIVIIPNWFQMNPSYAISRSAFAIDVKFGKDFERGFFSFYSFQAKRALYVKGKKEQNYRVIRPTFSGRFLGGYGVDEAEYRKAKREDLKRAEMEEEQAKPTREMTEVQIKAEIFKQMLEKIPGMTHKVLINAFGISQRQASRWVAGDIGRQNLGLSPSPSLEDDYNSNLIGKEITWDESVTGYEAERNEEEVTGE
jgi:hypothetical protein